MSEIIKGGQRPTDDIGDKIQAIWYGTPGSGKTTELLTYPSPIYMVNLDRDPGKLFQALPEHYTIHYERIQYDVDMSPSVAAAVLAKIDAHSRKAIASAKAGTITSFILDGFDILWEYVKVAKLPHSDPSQNVAREYGDANGWMHSFLARLYFQKNLHAGFTALSKEIWKRESRGEGTYDPEGFKHRGRWVTHEVYLFSPEDTAPKEKPSASAETGQTHRGYVKVSKVNEKEMVRRVIPNVTFKMLYRLTYGHLPDEHEKLWSPNVPPATPSK